MVETVVLEEQVVLAPGAIEFLKKMSVNWRIFLLTAGSDTRTKEVDVISSEVVGVCSHKHKS